MQCIQTDQQTFKKAMKHLTDVQAVGGKVGELFYYVCAETREEQLLQIKDVDTKKVEPGYARYSFQVTPKSFPIYLKMTVKEQFTVRELFSHMYLYGMSRDVTNTVWDILRTLFEQVAIRAEDVDWYHNYFREEDDE